MTTSVRFCLSYNRFKLNLITLKYTLFQWKTQRCRGRRYDVTCTRQNVMNILRDIRFL